MSIFDRRTRRQDRIVSAYLDGELNGEEIMHVENLVEQDDPLRSRLDRYRRVADLLQNASASDVPAFEISEAAERVRSRIDRTIRVRPMHQPWWRVRVSLPVPVLSAAAVLVLVLAGALTMNVFRSGQSGTGDSVSASAGLTGVGSPERQVNVQVNVDADHTDRLLQWLNEQGQSQQITIQLPEQAQFQLRGDPVLIRREATEDQTLRIIPLMNDEEDR